MSAITFPASPYTNQIFTVGSKSWQWDGSVWAAYYNEGVDSVYGTGMDGDITLDGSSTILGMAPSASVYTMTQDLYFNDLTINTSVRLNPNGYRIFVKNMLKFAGTNATIGFTTGNATSGSIAQGAAATTAVTNSLGGSASGYTATAPTSGVGGSRYYQIPRNAMDGYSLSVGSAGPLYLRGGAGGSGQAGGGVVLIAARYISGPSSGTAYIKAPGTAPAGGGVILLVSSNASLPAGISTDVTGQNPGTYYYIQQV
jgi:hypothetical protein